MNSAHLNQRFILLTLFLGLTLNLSLFSQELKHQKKSLGSRMREEFDVLKSNKEIKEGEYTLKYDNFICQIGVFKNNQRSGLWKIFYDKEDLELEYNFDTSELIYFNKKYYVSKDDSTLVRPIYLGGMKYFFQSVINNIDPNQMQWGNGSFVISFEVDPNGVSHKFLLKTSCGYKNLDLLAIKSVTKVATSTFKFLPATKDGNPISFVLDVPINYVARTVKMGPYK
jgi:hypothetical protein